MSIMQEAAACIAERGTATADDLLRDLPGYTRDQIMRAIQNAAYGGYVHMVGRIGSAHGRKTRLGIFAAGPKPNAIPVIGPRLVSSVWDLGRVAEGAMG